MAEGDDTTNTDEANNADAPITLKAAMSEPEQRQESQIWQQPTLNGLADYHALTTAAKELDAVAAAQHPGENHYYYPTFLNLIYKSLFKVKKGQTRGLRKRLTPAQRQKLHTVERHTAQWIRESLAASDDYHQVYYVVQTKVQALVKELGPEDLSQTVPPITTNLPKKTHQTIEQQPIPTLF